MTLLPTPGTKWRRYRTACNAAVFRDSLEAKSLWPFRRAVGRLIKRICTHESPTYAHGRLVCDECHHILRIERIVGDRIFTRTAVYTTYHP